MSGQLQWSPEGGCARAMELNQQKRTGKSFKVQRGRRRFNKEAARSWGERPGMEKAAKLQWSIAGTQDQPWPARKGKC